MVIGGGSGWFIAVMSKPTPLTISWTLHEPGISIGDKNWKPEERMQLGLRSDGIVVWRKGYQP